MNRRDFLLKARQRQAAPAMGRSLASGLAAYAGPWTANEAAHLLKRTMFGAKPGDVAHLLTLSVNDAVEELLNTTRAADPPLRDYGLIQDEAGAMQDDAAVPTGQTWVNDLNMHADNGVRGAINKLRTDSLRKWWAGLMLTQERSIEEKMILFWHHHFSVQKEEVENATLLYRHHDLLRRNATGNVRQLTKDITVDGAMLRHLNGFLNSKRAPDENYARELQELFTVGKGNDSHYTESDVLEAARVLTGWRINSDTLQPYFDAESHDMGTKRFSSFYANTVIGAGNDGITEVNQLIDMIFASTECARFICRKIYKWFVYYQIDQDTENNVIIPLADILRNSNFDIKPVLEALLKSEHFFDAANQSCHIKSPLDFIVGTLREFNAAIPAYTDHVAGYPLFFQVYEKAAEMQQDLFQPPDVSGWPSYYQDPMHYQLWVNSNTLPRRASFTDRLIQDNVIDLRSFAALSSDPSNPGQLIADITAKLLRYPLTTDSRLYVKNNFLTNNSGDDNVWTNAWNTNNAAVVNASLGNLFRFLMNLPEYHLC